jgi:hypothetical protein
MGVRALGVFTTFTGWFGDASPGAWPFLYKALRADGYGEALTRSH